MIRYVIKRLILLIPVIIAVSFLVFALMDLAPGDILSGLTGSLEEIATLRAQLGLDKPLLVRYAKYMFGLLQGDLGVSARSGLAVFDTFVTRLPLTLFLSLGSIIIGTAASIPLGIRSAKHAGTVSDGVTTAVTMVGVSMPVFWLAILLLLLFSHLLGWFPSGGARDGFSSYVLPSICGGLGLMAVSTRQTRSSMLEVLRTDFLRTARAKGVPEKMVIRKHALGNASIPIITTIGTSMSGALVNSVVVETVFAMPGIGRMVADAVYARDAIVVTGSVILTTIFYVVVLLIVDLVYAFVDPRIKAQYVSAKKMKKRSPIIDNAIAGSPDHPAAEVQQEPQTAPVREAVADVHVSPVTAPEKSFATRTVFAETRKSSVLDEAAASTVSVTKKYSKRSQMGEIFHSIRNNKGAMAGLIILTAMVLTLLGSLFISYKAMTAATVSDAFSPPVWKYPFGTDNLGRNLFLRVLYGTRYSLIIGVSAAVLTAIAGVFLGALSGFYGKLVDEIIMRFMDIVATIPGILLGMVIITVLGQTIPNVVIAVTIPGLPLVTRMTRASILTVKGNEFVEASKAIGLPNFRIIFTQVLPNGLAPIIVVFTTGLGATILIVSGLSFLGFGVPVPHPEWGALISSGREYMRTAPWLSTFPGMFILLTALSFNMLGDGLRDALDPKLKTR